MRLHFTDEALSRCTWDNVEDVNIRRQLLAIARWFPPDTPVSSDESHVSSSSFHRLDNTLYVARR